MIKWLVLVSIEATISWFNCPNRPTDSLEFVFWGSNLAFPVIVTISVTIRVTSYQCHTIVRYEYEYVLVLQQAAGKVDSDRWTCVRCQYRRSHKIHSLQSQFYLRGSIENTSNFVLSRICLPPAPRRGDWMRYTRTSTRTRTTNTYVTLWYRA